MLYFQVSYTYSKYRMQRLLIRKDMSEESEELEEIDRRLEQEDSIKQELKRNNFWMDFNLLGSSNPIESNRIIFRVVLLLGLSALAWVISFYI